MEIIINFHRGHEWSSDESRGRHDIFMCSRLLYYVNNLFMLIHEWRCEDIISCVLLKTGLTWSWEVFFWLWALKTIEAKKQLTLTHLSCSPNLPHASIPANFFWDISVRFLSWESWDFWRWHDHFWSFPKKSEGSRRSSKTSEDVRSLPKTSEVCQRRSYRVPVLGHV